MNQCFYFTISGEDLQGAIRVECFLDRERAASVGFYIHQKPRSRSEKSAADAKLEKTSLSTGGFLRVPMEIETLGGCVIGRR